MIMTSKGLLVTLFFFSFFNASLFSMRPLFEGKTIHVKSFSKSEHILTGVAYFYESGGDLTYLEKIFMGTAGAKPSTPGKKKIEIDVSRSLLTFTQQPKFELSVLDRRGFCIGLESTRLKECYFNVRKSIIERLINPPLGDDGGAEVDLSEFESFFNRSTVPLQPHYRVNGGSETEYGFEDEYD